MSSSFYGPNFVRSQDFVSCHILFNFIGTIMCQIGDLRWFEKEEHMFRLVHPVSLAHADYQPAPATEFLQFKTGDSITVTNTSEFIMCMSDAN